MFKKARDVKFLEKLNIEITYQDGNVIRFDMTSLFEKYPIFKQLENDDLFYKGHLDQAGLGIIWNDEIDIDVTSIYFLGEKVKYITPSINDSIGSLIRNIMDEKGISQVELAKMSKIDQADIYRLINGQGNPTLAKIDKVIKALGKELEIKIK